MKLRPDFSKHLYRSEPANDLYELYTEEGSSYNSVKIRGIDLKNRAYGKVLVTGDYGTWVFGPQFPMPGTQSIIDPVYLSQKLEAWCDSIRILSVDKTHEAIDNYEKSSGDEEDMDPEIVEEWCDSLRKILRSTHDENEYLAQALQCQPEFLGTEDVPCSTELNPWLQVIFAAWEEMNRRETELRGGCKDVL